MADIVTWHGDGLSAGAFASGSGDTAHASVQGTAPTVVESGDRPPRIRFPGGTSATYVVWTFSALSELAIRWYGEFPTMPAGFRLFALIISGSTSGFNLDVTGSGQLQIHQGGSIRATSTGTIPTGQPVRIEAIIDPNGLRSVQAYEGHGTTPVATASWEGPATTITQLWFGQTFSATTPERFADDLILRDESLFIGPTEEGEPDKPVWLAPISIGATAVEVEWEAYPGATGYDIERKKWGDHAPLYRAAATDFGLDGLQSQSWFNDLAAAGYDGFITTLHTFWSCVNSVYGDAATALERALNAGMWIGAYARPASEWIAALDSLPAALRDQLRFYDIDIEEEPCGFHPPTRPMIDSIKNDYGLKPLIYSGYWIWQQAGMDVENDEFSDVPLWDWFGNYHETDWPEDIREAPMSTPFGGWNVPGNHRVGWQIRMSPAPTFQGIAISDEVFTKQFIDAELTDNPIIAMNHQGTTFQDSGLNPSQEYQYRVGAVMG